MFQRLCIENINRIMIVIEHDNIIIVELKRHETCGANIYVIFIDKV